jgi:hypothetical protein
MTIYLQEEFSDDKVIVDHVHIHTQIHCPGHIVKKTEIYYDPDVQNSVVGKDRLSLSKFDFAPKTDDDLRRLSLVLRLELDKAIVFGKKIQMDEITRKSGTSMEGSQCRGDG